MTGPLQSFPRQCGAAGRGLVRPIAAQTRTFHSEVLPVAYDWVKLIFVRDGSAILLSEFGERPVAVGDVVALAANTLCGSEPEGSITATTLYLDRDYVIDQVFWQHAALLADRLDAQDFADELYSEPAQILRLGESRLSVVAPLLDELVTLSTEDRPVRDFYRMQALWFSIADVIAPFIQTSPIRISSTQRSTAWPTSPRHRPLLPLRTEARTVAEMLSANPERRWSVTSLADAVHLSKSQLGRVFVEAYGKSPIAYLTMLRAERMAYLLRTTDMPTALIAREVGWRDPDFAARQFRRSVGITPSRYRDVSRTQAERVSR